MEVAYPLELELLENPLRGPAALLWALESVAARPWLLASASRTAAHSRAAISSTTNNAGQPYY